MQVGGSIAASGVVKLKKLRLGPAGSWSGVPMKELSVWEIFKHGLPWFGLGEGVAAWRFKNIPNLWRGVWRVLLARLFSLPTYYGTLSLAVLKADGTIIPYGLASLRVVTTAGVNFIVDAFQNTTELENLKFHGFGTNNTAEAAGDTALGTEETTQYNPDNTRPTGTTTEGASANIYRTVATYTPDSGGTRAIVEHGVFSQAATGGGTLLDRSVFSVINVTGGSGDAIQATYELTLPSGS